MLTVLNGFSRFVYLCVLLQRVLFNNAGCGTRCKSGRSSGASPLPGVKELHLGGRASSAPPGCRPKTGGPAPRCFGALRTGWFLPALGLPPSFRQSEAEGKPRRWTCTPSGHLTLPAGSHNCPTRGEAQPAIAGGWKEGGKEGGMPAGGCRAAGPGATGSVRGSRPALIAPPPPGGPYRAVPCPAVPSRAQPCRGAARRAPSPCGSFPPPGVPGAVSPPRRAPAATDGASARLETDSFCK